MHVETIAGQHYACNVLSYIMNIALDGGQYDRIAFGSCALALITIHIRFQNLHSIPHYLGGFYDLRKEHLAVSKQPSDLFHTCHQRTFDYFDCSTIFL